MGPLVGFLRMLGIGATIGTAIGILAGLIIIGDHLIREARRKRT